jgi:hypothetical protein
MGATGLEPPPKTKAITHTSQKSGAFSGALSTDLARLADAIRRLPPDALARLLAEVSEPPSVK